MPLCSGTRLGPYEVLGPLGAGGMGEVYRARDTRLGRDVAIKVLPAEVAQDAERRARFEREARAVSSLNHPHICALYDVGQQDGLAFLVMEYLEGQTLADALAKGPLPTDQVLRNGIEIADALAQAHKHGVVHRDLKPSNIMLTKAGVKLLDFGLAKTCATGALGLDSELATGTRHVTQAGTLLGTYQYMAPEQLEGKEADARADIWALGCVLYEMVTGQRAFSGKSHASLVAAILKEDPRPMQELQPLAPPSLERLVRTCLAKDPDERWQSAHDVVAELKWTAEGGSQVSAAGSPLPALSRRETLAWSIAAVSAIAAVLAASALLPRKTATPGRIVSEIAPPDKLAFSDSSGPMALSPDGRQLAFVVRDAKGLTQLWIRPLGGGEARALAGTEDAADPFWSPDGRFIAFFAGRRLKKLDVAGGQPEALADAPLPIGGTWGRDGTILFAPYPYSRLSRVAPGAGASPVPGALGPGVGHFRPCFLPDGLHFLFGIVGSAADGIYLGTLGSEETRLLVPAVSNVDYVEPGILVYWRDGVLRAQRFDARTLQVRGEAVRIVDHVPFDAAKGCARFSASRAGLLVYQRGGLPSASQMVWVDRSGRDLGAPLAPAGFYYFPRISHDGRRVAVDISDPLRNNGDIWIFDVARSVSSRFTFDAVNETAPLWSPDDAEILFTKTPDLYRKALAASAAESLVLSSPEAKLAADWSQDGRHLLFVHLSGSNIDIWHLPLPEGKAEPWLATPFDENGPRFSPDGACVAFASDESGRQEVYVRSFAGSGEKTRVSPDSGSTPVWRSDGKELFYVADDKRLMAIPVRTSPRFEADTPRALFEARLRSVVFRAQYDVTADGQRFLLNRMVGDDTVPPMTLVQNWIEEILR